MYENFDLGLMVNHACNLRCTYCYTGAKFWRSMDSRLARTAVDRAMSSLKSDGQLELGFFGGEPLLEASLIRDTIEYAESSRAERRLVFGLTTNGTVTEGAAWLAAAGLAPMALTFTHNHKYGKRLSFERGGSFLGCRCNLLRDHVLRIKVSAIGQAPVERGL